MYLISIKMLFDVFFPYSFIILDLSLSFPLCFHERLLGVIISFVERRRSLEKGGWKNYKTNDSKSIPLQMYFFYFFFVLC